MRVRDLDVAEVKRFVPDTVRLVRRLAKDDSLKRGVRWRAYLLVAYLALPFDLVPDFIPVIGYADDVIVTALVLRSIVRRAGPDTVARNWSGTEAGLAVIARLAGIPVATAPGGNRPRPIDGHATK